MNLRKITGGCLLVIGLPFLPITLLMYLDPFEGTTAIESLALGLLFWSVLLLPGFALYIGGRKAQDERRFYDAVTGMVRSHDRFGVVELAGKIGRTELETETLIAQIVAADNGIELAFYRATREYVHRASLIDNERVVEKCVACGAPTNNQVVLVGETATCTYCHVAIVAQG